jgi:N-acetylmuramic acid 6-phosphate (MurNAc-6-P) etherase
VFEKIKAGAKEVVSKVRKIDSKDAQELQGQAEKTVKKAKVVKKEIKQKEVKVATLIETKDEGKKFLGIFKKSTKK